MRGNKESSVVRCVSQDQQKTHNEHNKKVTNNFAFAAAPRGLVAGRTIAQSSSSKRRSVGPINLECK